MDRASRLSEPEQKAFAALETSVESFAKGTDLVRPGDRHSRPFILQSGYVIVARHNSTGQRMIIDLMIPGDIGNARAIVLPRADMLYTALNDIVVSRIPIEAHRDLMLAHPRPSMALLWTGAISRSLLAERLYSLGRRNGYQRTGHFLLELRVRLEEVGLTDGPSFRAPLTLAVLGDLLGLTPEHVSRVVQRLRRDGFLVTKRDHWQFIDLPGMEKACDFDPAYLHTLDRELVAFSLHEIGTSAAMSAGRPPDQTGAGAFMLAAAQS
ncbi:MAG: Crp/Fnr family transcriptional regulator [Dongiaceae bacterium]